MAAEGGQREFTMVWMGWLGEGQSYPVGEAEPGFATRLLEESMQLVNQTRGFQPCPFCSHPPFGMPVQVAGQPTRLGSADSLFCGRDGTLYYTPNLIYHYVTAHGYLPAQEFREAVLAGLELPGDL